MDYPEFWSFSPIDGATGSVILTLDEYEVIKNIDYLAKTQEETASIMNVARTTITSIYNEARAKIAMALVTGKKIHISGGNYSLHDSYKISIKDKPDGSIRIVIPHLNGNVFEHFGLALEFKFYDIQNGIMLNEEIIKAGGPECKSYAGLLKIANTDILICDVIGYNAQASILEAGIKLYANKSGNINKVISEFINDNMSNSSIDTDNQ